MTKKDLRVRYCDQLQAHLTTAQIESRACSKPFYTKPSLVPAQRLYDYF
jgi:hypothetical protein